MFIEKLKRLEPKCKGWTIDNIGLYIVGLQAIFYLLILSEIISHDWLVLYPAKVIGELEIWRIFTFGFISPDIPTSGMGLLYLIIKWYVFIVITQYLEAYWGTFLLNLYCLFVFAFSILAAFLVFLIASEIPVYIDPQVFFHSFFFIIFLAFAVLNPEFEMLLFFVLPLKVKYLAYISCALYLLSFLSAEKPLDKVLMLICVFTFALFFYDTIKLNLKQKKRIRVHRKQSVSLNEAMHNCAQCGKSDISNPELEFRYRNQNGKAVCYCNLCRS